MNIRTKPLLPELFYQWTHYRVHLLSERFQREAESLEDRYTRAVQECDSEGRPGHCTIETVDVGAPTRWMDEQMHCIRQTLLEVRAVTSEDNINKNYISQI